MSDKQSASPAMAFILAYLKEHGDVEYAQVKEAAEADGHNIYPIMYGRAKTLLNMITDESKRRRRRPAAPKGESAQSRSRRLRQGASGSASEATANELSSFLERFREMEGERNRYRAALLSVEKLLRQALEEVS